MATTASQAIDGFAEATGTLPATVFRAARAMREASRNLANTDALWPWGSKGRGKAALPTQGHLVNLAMAVSMADPITDAPQIVAEYRNLTVPGELYFAPKDMGAVFQILFSEIVRQEGVNTVARGVFGGEGGLGGDLERLVEFLADPDLSDEKRLALRICDFEVRLIVGGLTPTAQVSYENDDGTRKVIPYCMPLSTLKSLPFQARAPLVRIGILSINVFTMLGELWDATLRSYANMPLGAIVAGARRNAVKANRAFTNSQPDAPNSSPENDTAAIHPCQGTNAAALSDQPARTELDRTQQPYPTGEREKSQSSSDSQAGHSPQTRSDPHDKPREGGAYGAAA